MDGVFQETGEESCQSICDAVNATAMDDTISGLSDPRLDGTFTCTTAVVDGQCSGIAFYVKPNMDGSADILVSNSPASECVIVLLSNIKVEKLTSPIVINVYARNILAACVSVLLDLMHLPTYCFPTLAGSFLAVCSWMTHYSAGCMLCNQSQKLCNSAS